jgi:deoxyadenosine/deoxycytidine kinase
LGFLKQPVPLEAATVSIRSRKKEATKEQSETSASARTRCIKFFEEPSKERTVGARNAPSRVFSFLCAFEVLWRTRQSRNCILVSHLKFIAIAGNIGAGKTELTGFLCRKYGIKPFYEPNDLNPYLADFYKDMKTWAMRSQLFFLTHKFKLHRELEREKGTAIQDRTIYEDAEIFARNLYRQKFIDKRDWNLYSEMYETISSSLRPPDLMIYLRCPVKTLKQRIKIRGRKMEQDIPTAYLKRLNVLYEDWFKRYTLSPVLTLQTDTLDYLTNLVDRVDLFRQIEKHL